MQVTPEEEREFCRMVEKPDSWTEPGSLDTRADEFRGKYDDISVAHTANCPPELVLASLIGSRRGVGPVIAYYYRFLESEAIAAGGKLKPTDAEPPWPPEYNEAHHDIHEGQSEVARHMAHLHDGDRARVVEVPQVVYLGILADLLVRSGVHERFTKNGWKRLRRLFEDEPGVWAALAATRPHMLADATIRSTIRTWYQKNREKYEELAAKLPTLREKGFTTG